MAAKSRDIAMFAFGLALAGLLPIIALPSLQLSAVLSMVASSAGGLPVVEMAIIAFLAVLGAAWIDTQEQPEPDLGEWE